MTLDVKAPGPTGTPTTAADQKSLDRALVRGVAWTGGMRWATQLVSWSVTILLARILSLSDYGLYGTATLYIGFVQLVNEFGLGSAIVRRRDLTARQISALGGISVALGFALWGLSALLAPLVAAYFKAPSLRWPLTVLSAVFVLTAFKVLPKSLFSRDLQFKRVATVDAIEAIVGALATLGLALAGLGAWALVWGAIIGGTASTLTAVFWRRHPLGWPSDWAEIAPAITFGSHIMGSRIAWWAYSNADFATVGRRLGQALLGAYTYGWTIASIPVDRISGLVGQVTPSIFSAVQDDLPMVRRYLLRITEALALLTVPFSFGLASVADQFTVVVLGDRWWPTIGPLTLLSFYASIRSIATPYPHVLNSLGHSGRTVSLNIRGVLIMVPLFILGSFRGIDGVALAWIIGYPMVAWPLLTSVLRATEMTAGEYFDAVRPPLRAALAMAIVVFAIRMVLPEQWPVPLQLAIEVPAGAATYVGIMLGFYGDHLQNLKALGREFRK